jgi:arylsulfatase A-like enzyme
LLKSTFNRRNFLAGSAVACALPGFGKSVQRPNVLFVVIDDLRPLISCQGDPVAITPNLDALASDGMVFERAYAQYPICGPSRGSFLSGLRPDTSGLMTNNTPFHNALPNALTLNRYFMKEGYEVFGAGKVYHNSTGEDWSKPYFKTEWLDHVKPENKQVADAFFTKDSKGLPPSVEAEDVGDDAYCDGQAAAASEKWISEASKADKPFMMVTGFRKPHLPWCAPKKYWDLYERSAMPIAENRYHPKGAPEIALKQYGELFGYADIPKDTPLTDELVRQCMHGYYACVSYADAQLGRLLAALKKAGVYENTVVVLCGDNGYQHGNNGVWTKGVNWESTNHVPLLLKVPNVGLRGQRSSALVELLDIYPTVCEAAGLKIPKHCEGQSLLPLLQNPRRSWSEVACSQFRKGKVIGRSIRTDRYRFTLWEKKKGELVGTELYDHQKDPQGNINLAASPENERLVEKMTRLHRKQWPNQYE